MSKTNAEETIVFICKSISSLGTCMINAKGCSRTIVTEITIQNHPEAVRKNVCASPNCVTEAKLQLRRKIR